MKIKTNYYEEIFEAFRRKCQSWAEQAVEYRPKHEHSIRVTLDNGDNVDYNIRTDSFKYNSANDKEKIGPKDISDSECRNTFAYNLVDRMRTKGFGQASLAEKTGLSTATINKYINKLATPTITNLIRIAKALDCDVEDLIE